MVAHLVRLKLSLLRNSLRRSPWQLVGVVIGALYGLGLLVALLSGLFALGSADPTLARTVLVLAGSAVVLGWGFIPLLVSGVDMTLDPARFVTYAVPLKQLLAGLMLGALIGVPGAVTLLATMGQSLTWWRSPAALAAALACGVLATLICVAFSRLTTSATTALTSSRRFKDVAGVVAMIPLILLGPIVGGASMGLESAAETLPAVAEVLAWTPLGSTFAVPADIAAGAYGPAALRVLISLAALALLVWLWKLSLARALVTPVRHDVARRSAGNLGMFRYFPATPTGAVAARALTYWLRDPRYGGSLILIPLIPLLLAFTGYQAGDYGALLYLGPITAFILSYAISADVSYDNTAFALHVSTGVSGRADRAGRVLGCAVFAVPVTLVFSVVPAVLLGSGAQLPAVLGLSAGLLLTGFGLSSVVSARYTYNVPLPGESPFKTPPGSGFRLVVVQLGTFLGLGVLAAPEIVLFVLALVTGEPFWGWLTAAVGLLLGAVLLSLGVRIGGRWYDTRTPELLLAVSRNK